MLHSPFLASGNDNDVTPRLSSHALNALKGAAFALIFSLLWAVVFAYLFRLPIPFVGYIGPFETVGIYATPVLEALQTILMAWVFYGVLGGFVVAPLLGALTGVAIGARYATSNNKDKRLALWSGLAGVVPVFILSILDFFIGPW